jgi:phytoene dehydrogenase-like protein
MHICPSMDYVEHAWDDAKYGRPSERPLLEMTVPTMYDPSLAPPGKHIMGIFLQYAPYTLREGDWTTEKDRFAKRCVETLAWLMPDIEDRILDMRCFGPQEIEAELGLVGSNITHGDMMPGDLFGSRPHPLANDYRTPLKGLYLTGSGTWPGGYVTGIPGHNASRAVLHDLKETRR